MTRAVVFAYHNVGVRCLSVLLDAGVDVALVVTHNDDCNEHIWFDSVAKLAARYGLPCIAPENPDTAEIVSRLQALQPDFLFSFYYRHMLKASILSIPKRGALNMHGSLLPHYRGRVPVNWAIIHGEKQTGATLHYMNEKPDAGDMVAQTAVPILSDDLAIDVFHKVTCAAEITLHRALPALIDGTVRATPLDLSRGSYFGGRHPEDGHIDWSLSARVIHNLIRAVAPPYPGAFTRLQGKPLRVLRSRVIDDSPPLQTLSWLVCDPHGCRAHCGGGCSLDLLDMEWNGMPTSAADLLNITDGKEVYFT